MTNVRVKICGITNTEEAIMAVEEGADSLGFVFAQSTRRVTPETVAEITSEIPPFISLTGVFVNETMQRVLDIALKTRIDTLQFHGEEDEDYCLSFKGFRLIKSFAATPSMDYERVLSFPADAILLDTKYRDKRGGGGKIFDWNLALPLSGKKKPLILAGGLNPGNIYEALETLQPFAVDVSSGVESNGVKDREKVKLFMDEVRRYNNSGRNECE